MVIGKLLNVSLFALLCTASTALPMENDGPELSVKSNEIDYRLPNNTVPLHYDLKLVPDLDDTFTFDGEILAKFEVRKPTSDVALHLDNLTLNENATRLTLKNGDTVAPERHQYDKQTEILLIHFPHCLETGEYILELQFSGTLNDELYGFYKCHYQDRKGNAIWVGATQFEPISARRAFPCWDEPALKATFNISIKHHPNHTALSNMPVRQRSEIDAEDGKMWTHFERTPIMSTYLVAFVVADFYNVSNDDETISIWSRKALLPHLSFALDIAEKASKELGTYTNSTVRVPKMDHVALPDHSTEAMENWGLITYSEANLVYRKNKSSVERMFGIAATVIHELAHQWFGNVVSPTWWSHIWLNEGFASYFQHYVIGRLFSGLGGMNHFVVGILQDSLSTDSKWHLNPIDTDIRTSDQIEEVFSRAVYNKAPSILHMLSSIITPDVFQKGIVKYLNRHEYASADSDCLWKALQESLDESEVSHSDFNLKEVMDTWIQQKRYPIVYVARDYDTGNMTIGQRDFGTVDVHKHSSKEAYKDENEQYEWWVPINYATQSNPDFSNTRPTHWLIPKKNLTIDGIGTDDWVIINKQQSGYYRVAYDDANWRKIAQNLRSENFSNIHVLNRAQIIDDVAELLLYEKVDPSIFLSIVTYLSQETDYIPWHSMLRFLKRVSNVLEFPSAGPIKNFVVSVMDNVVKEVGFEDNLNDDPAAIFKRYQVLKWACIFGHGKCREAATAKLLQHLEEPKLIISPNQKIWMYENALRSANESVWNKVFDWAVKNSELEVFRTLCLTENPALIQKFISAAMSNDTAIPAEKKELMVALLFSINTFSASVIDVLHDFYDQRWDEIISRYGYLGLPVSEDAIALILRKVYTEEQYVMAKKFCVRRDEKFCRETGILERILDRIRNVQNALKQWNQLISNI